MKKALFLLTLFALSIVSHAAPLTYSVWDGTASPITPSGTVYTVTTAAELAWLSLNNDANNGYNGYTIRLDADINLDGRLWTPLGSSTKPFLGTLEGQNHVVKGLRFLQGSSAIGLLGTIGSTGAVSHIGVAGDKILANGKHAVGALAGVNNGTITYAWSSTEIAIAGTVVGGLVGVNNGTIDHCYNAGLILQTVDTIGGLAGINSGTISNSYNVGYALNGNAIAGHDDHGQYINCYYDRQLYYQPATDGVTAEPAAVQPIDETTQMFGIFSDDSQWVTSTDRYPQLSGFETTDASVVSVSPALMAYVGTTAEHANDFLSSFELTISQGESWSLKEGTADVTISGSTCTIRRSCDGGYVLLAVAINDEEKVMYFRPRRLEDFTPARMTVIEDDSLWCNPGYFVMQELFTLSPARGGWIYDSYEYLFVVDSVDVANSDTLRIDTLAAGSWAEITAWYDTAYYETTVAGAYILTLLSRDDLCHTDWESNGHYYFEVSEEFDGGHIGFTTDTVYAESVTINVPSIKDASGGAGAIHYVWIEYDLSTGQGELRWDYTSKSLTYTIEEAGEYLFTRVAYDEKCATDYEGHPLAWGYYDILLRDPIDPGELIQQSELETLCVNTDGNNDTLRATTPSGGSGVYQYRWLVNGVVLAGAIEAYLPLADVQMVNGQTYTIVRQVKDDYRLSEWANSLNTQVIAVSAGFTTGAIETGTLPQYCIMGGVATQMVTVQIASTEDAAGNGTLEYAWYRAEEDGSNAVRIASTAALDVTFPVTDIEVNKTYRYYRTVRDADCGSAWSESTGVAYQYYRANDHQDSTLTICATLFPYTVYYPDPVEGPYFHKFTKDECGVPYTFSNILADPDCYPTLTLTVDSLEAPEVWVDSVAKLCQDAGTITIYYEVLSGSPDSFYIELSPSLTRYFDNRNYISGTMEPVGVGETGKILLTDVNRIGMGTNYMYVQVGNRIDAAGEESCFSMMHRMDLEFNLGGYIYAKYDKMLFVDNEPDTDESLTFVRYQWYKNGVKLEGETGQYYHENGATLVGTYYCDLTTIENGTEVTYQSCDVDMPQEAASASSNPAREEARMFLTDGQVVIELNGVMYDIYGRILQ